MTDFPNMASKMMESSKPERADTCSQSSIHTCRTTEVNKTRASDDPYAQSVRWGRALAEAIIAFLRRYAYRVEVFGFRCEIWERNRQEVILLTNRISRSEAGHFSPQKSQRDS